MTVLTFLSVGVLVSLLFVFAGAFVWNLVFVPSVKSKILKHAKMLALSNSKVDQHVGGNVHCMDGANWQGRRELRPHNIITPFNRFEDNALCYRVTMEVRGDNEVPCLLIFNYVHNLDASYELYQMDAMFFSLGKKVSLYPIYLEENAQLPDDMPPFDREG